MKKVSLTIIAAFLVFASFAQADTTARQAREKKPIKEFKIWKNGQQFDASDIDLICVYDDYEKKATVYYEITDSLGVVVANGNIDITGADYEQYVNRAKHPETALNLTLKTLRIQQRAASAAKQAAKQAAGTGSQTSN